MRGKFNIFFSQVGIFFPQSNTFRFAMKNQIPSQLNDTLYGDCAGATDATQIVRARGWAVRFVGAGGSSRLRCVDRMCCALCWGSGWSRLPCMDRMCCAVCQGSVAGGDFLAWTECAVRCVAVELLVEIPCTLNPAGWLKKLFYFF